MTSSALSFWTNFKASFLKKAGNSQIHKSWLDAIKAEGWEQKKGALRLTLLAPSGLHKKWLEENMVKKFKKYALQSHQEGLELCLKVKAEARPTAPPLKKESYAGRPLKKQNVFLNPDYTFENFIVGKNSELAFSAGQAVSNNRVRDFNPLFIYGPSGLGKTHLLNAIGHQFAEKNPQKKIIYLSAERFLNEYISALRFRQTASFRSKFRKNCDLLLIDDIQIIARGREIQEEFFHTFNEIHGQGGRIAVCCDRPPYNVPRLESRIRTRFEGGLMADISFPDQETRMAILKSKMEKNKLSLPLSRLEEIASKCKSSVREMEGLLNKIKVMTALKGPLSENEIKEVLKDAAKQPTIELIKEKTAKGFGLSAEDLKSPSRKKNIVAARQTAMYLIRKRLGKPLSDISSAFNRKDHTTALSALKKVEREKIKNPDFKGLLEDINKDIH